MAPVGRVFAINLLANSKPAENAFARVGQSAGRISTPMKIAATAITAVFAASLAVATKVTKALFDLGQEFDDVYDTIRIQTGITGQAFEGLQESFRDVAVWVPNDFADIGTAIQDLNTRLGLTGNPLEEMAIQLLTVTRLMGGDIQSNVRVATRLFGDFSVKAEDQAETLDMLFRASQASGQGFATLADQTVNYGADLRALGFDLPQAVSALALFERTGVNTETVMSGLRLAVSNLAKNGEDIPTAFSGAITTIRDAATESEAFGVAVELVGTRYASNFLDTIRGGKFDLDTFVEQITQGSETIQGAAADTDGFRESWQNFKNYLKITLEPAAAAVFENLELLVGQLRPAADNIVKAFEEDGLQGALEQLAEEWDKIYTERIQPLFIKFLAFLDETVKPIALEIGSAIGAAIAAGMWSAFKSGVSNLFSSNARDRIFAAIGNTEAVSALKLAPNRALESLRNLGNLGLPAYGGPVTPFTPNASGPNNIFGDVRMAEGGVVSSATLALIGEAGPEAVIPLDRLGGGGGNNIYVTVTSADPQAVVEALRRYTRANGPLGQVVSV